MTPRTAYYKLHESDNNGQFDKRMFTKAPVVLFEVPNDGPPAVYFLVDQSKEKDYNEVGMLELEDDFELPELVKKISAREFKRMTA